MCMINIMMAEQNGEEQYWINVMNDNSAHVYVLSFFSLGHYVFFLFWMITSIRLRRKTKLVSWDKTNMYKNSFFAGDGRNIFSSFFFFFLFFALI